MTTKTTTFAARLATLRERAGLSMLDLAERSGVGRTYLYELERGAKLPGWEVACALADALQVDVGKFR